MNECANRPLAGLDAVFNLIHRKMWLWVLDTVCFTLHAVLNAKQCSVIDSNRYFVPFRNS